MLAATLLVLNAAAIPPPTTPTAPPPGVSAPALPAPEAAAPVAPAPGSIPASAPAAENAPATDTAAPAPNAEPAAPDAATVVPAPSDEATPPAASTEATATPADDLELATAETTKDPLQGFNRISFGLSMVIDKIVIRPAAMVYRHVVPKPGRDGVHNALTNLGEPVVFLNDLLQLRPKRMLRTLGRFLINSTLGLGGLFDVAKRKPFHLEHHANSFGDTLGYYGVKPGPYIYIPVFGPTTLRDMLGYADGMIPPKVLPQIYNRSDLSLATTIAGGLDQRERNDDDLKAMKSDSIDFYASFRANFMQDRAGEIAALKAKDGQALSPTFDDPLIDPQATAPTKEAAPETSPAEQAPRPALPSQR